MKQQSFRRGIMGLYISMFILGVVFIVISSIYVINRIDPVSAILERWDWYISARDVSIAGPGGTVFQLNIAKNDRESAWKIYTQISTRVAAVDFNEDYDSALKVHESLYALFGFIRDEISQIPVSRIQRDTEGDTVKFYLEILNDGLRPHLSRWHVPLEKWVDSEQKLHPKQNIIEIEKRFPARTEMIASFKKMNERMRLYADKLLLIVKAR